MIGHPALFIRYHGQDSASIHVGRTVEEALAVDFGEKPSADLMAMVAKAKEESAALAQLPYQYSVDGEFTVVEIPNIARTTVNVGHLL